MSTTTIRESGDGLVASHVSVTDRSGRVIVDDVSVNARSGRTLVIVGESGAGKSMLARTLCALTPLRSLPAERCRWEGKTTIWRRTRGV